MSRTDGRKLVALATAAIVGTIGVGTIYVPFMMDRDKLRGLFEEGHQDSIPEGARREIRAIAKAEQEEKRRLQSQQQQPTMEERPREEEQPPQRQKASAGSMWSSFRRNS